MAAPPSPTDGHERFRMRRASAAGSVAQSVASASQSAVNFTENLVLNRDPPLGFFAATAAATSKAPTVGDIRGGSFGQDGWSPTQGATGSRDSTRSSMRRQSGSSKDRPILEKDGRGMLEPFAPLTEEPSRISTDVSTSGEKVPTTATRQPRDTALEISETTPSTSAERERTDHDRIRSNSKDQKVYSSGYIPPPKLPWTTSTKIGLKAFWKWFLTPFGFLFTIYGLNVVAWGGMLFLLLCNASPAMCWAPIPNAQNQKHVSPVAALLLPGPYYKNCNDINSSRRIWLEIDSQILNALFCVTGLGLIPWRFRDLYYLLKWRLTSEKSHGSERKTYGLRVLAGIYRGWFRLPGSETLDSLSTQEYLASSKKTDATFPLQRDSDIETAPSALSSPEHDPRIPLPVSKMPDDPPTSVRAPPTKLWKVDLFVWCAVWNTFFQCCLCGCMWGMDRYERPPWTTGLFIALAFIIAGVGGIASFIEGKHVKKVEGVAPKDWNERQRQIAGLSNELSEVRKGVSDHGSAHVDQLGKTNGTNRGEQLG